MPAKTYNETMLIGIGRAICIALEQLDAAEAYNGLVHLNINNRPVTLVVNVGDIAKETDARIKAHGVKLGDFNPATGERL